MIHKCLATYETIAAAFSALKNGQNASKRKIKTNNENKPSSPLELLSYTWYQVGQRRRRPPWFSHKRRNYYWYQVPG